MEIDTEMGTCETPIDKYFKTCLNFRNLYILNSPHWKDMYTQILSTYLYSFDVKMMVKSNTIKTIFKSYKFHQRYQLTGLANSRERLVSLVGLLRALLLTINFKRKVPSIFVNISFQKQSLWFQHTPTGFSTDASRSQTKIKMASRNVLGNYFVF